MKKISLLTIALIALVLCMDMAQAEHLVLQEEKQECAPNELSLENLSNEEEPQQQMQQRKTSTFVFKEEAAVKGKVRVKLSEEAAQQVEKKMGKANVLKARSESAKLRIGVPSVETKMQAVKASSMKRVFPYHPRYEERQRESGLHLWYEFDIDTEAKLSEVCASLAKDDNVAYVEPILKKVIRGVGGKSIDRKGLPAKQSQIVLTPTSAKKQNNIATKTSSSPIPLSTRSYEDNPPVNDPMLLKQWHYYNYGQVISADGTSSRVGADIKLFDAWKVNMGKPNVIVSIHDEGVQTNHPDLAANMWVNEAELNGEEGVDDDGNGYVDDIHGYNFATGISRIVAGDHGCHTAGTVAAVNNNGVGVAGVAGGSGNNDGVRLMGCQVFQGEENAGFATSYVYAANNGAVISQNSWGHTVVGYYQQVVLDAIDYFIKYAGRDEYGNPLPNTPMVGGIVIFASGNDGETGAMYPGYYESCFTVASVGPWLDKPSYTNYGEWVDIAAPGGSMTTHGEEAGVLSCVTGGGYKYQQGTSMACPHVSGVAALVLSEYGHAAYTPEMLKNRLVSSASPWDELNLPDYVGLMGVGMLNAQKALAPDEGIAPETITDLKVTSVGYDFGKLTFKAPSDKDNESAFSYSLRYSTSMITEDNFEEGSALYQVASKAGLIDEIVVDKLQGETTYYAAVKAVDVWGNISGMSNVVEFTTREPPSITYTPEQLTIMVDDAPNTKGTSSLTIGNKKGGDLRYSVHYTLKKEPNSNLSQITDQLSNFDLYNEELSRGSFGSDGSERFLAATRIDVTLQESFVLTDILAAINPEWNINGVGTYTDETFGIKIYRGGKTPTEGKNVFDALFSVPYVYYYVNGGGADLKFALGDTYRFEQGEHFWIVFDFVEGFLAPMAIHGGTKSPQGNELYSTDGESWIDINTVQVGNMQPNYAYRVSALSNQNSLPKDLITLEPNTGYVSAGSSQKVNILVDASKVEEGQYETLVHIDHNDPTKNPIRVPVNFTVDGHRSGIRSKKEVTFNSTVQGYSDTLNLMLYNDSLGILNIDTIYSDRPQFSVEPAGSIEILPGDSLMLKLKFTAPSVSEDGTTSADSVGLMLSKLNFKTNTVEETYEVIMDAVSISRPVLSLDRLSEDIELKMGESKTVEFTLKNDGEYRLDYKLEEDETTDYNFFDTDPSLKMYYGKLEHVGYWSGLSTYSAVNITDEIKGRRNKIVPLPFTFNYYGANYDTITIAGNGNIHMGAQKEFLSNPSRLGLWAIPKTIFPCYNNTQTMVTDAGGEALLKIEGGQVTVEFTKMGKVSAAGEGETVRVQVVLHSDGKIEMKYKNFREVESESKAEKLLGLIGMSDNAGSEGLGIWLVKKNFNKPGTYIAGPTYLYGSEESVIVWQGERRDTLFYEWTPPVIEYNKNTVITITPENVFAQDITPSKGSLMPGEEVTVRVKMGIDKNLKEGIYARTVPIITNDPENKKAGFLVNIDFKSDAKPSINLTDVNFGKVGKTITAKATVPVRNLGGKPFTATAYMAEGTYFKVLQANPVECAGLASIEYDLEFSPIEEKVYEDRLVIEIEGGAPFSLGVKGEGVKIPKIELVEGNSTIDWTVNRRTGSTDPLYRDTTLTIRNVGELALDYNVMSTEWIKNTTMQAKSGIDKSGYFWSDNLDDQSGVQYEWIDENPILYNPIAWSEGKTKLLYAKEFELPWAFEYYGETFTKCYVNMSGMVYFNENDIIYVPALLNASQASELIIPEQGSNNGYIAALGGSFDNSQQWYEVIGEGDDAKVVFTWHARPLYDAQLQQDTNYVTFQTILHKDGGIKFQYKDVESAWWRNRTVIGIENRDGTDGLNICNNDTKYIRNGLAIYIKPSKVETLQPGETKKISFRADASNLWELNSSSRFGETIESHKGNILISSNDPSSNLLQKNINMKVKGEVEIQYLSERKPISEVNIGEVLRTSYPEDATNPDENGVASYVARDKSYSVSIDIVNKGTKTMHIHDEKRDLAPELPYIRGNFSYTSMFPPQAQYVEVEPTRSYRLNLIIYPSGEMAPEPGDYTVYYPIAIRSNLGSEEACEEAGYTNHVYVSNFWGGNVYSYSYKADSIKLSFSIADVPLENINIPDEVNEFVFQTRDESASFAFDVENQTVSSPNYWNDIHKSNGTLKERAQVTKQADLSYSMSLEYLTKAEYEELTLADKQEVKKQASQEFKLKTIQATDLNAESIDGLISKESSSVQLVGSRLKSAQLLNENEEYLDSIGYFNYDDLRDGYLVNSGLLTNYARFKAGNEGFNLTHISSAIAKFENVPSRGEEIKVHVLIGKDARTADLVHTESFTPEIAEYFQYTPVEHSLEKSIYIYPNQYFWIALENKQNTSVQSMTWNSQKLYVNLYENFMVSALDMFDYATVLTRMYTGWNIVAWSNDKIESAPSFISLSKLEGEVPVGSKEQLTVSVNPGNDLAQLDARYARIQITSNDPYPYGVDSIMQSEEYYHNQSNDIEDEANATINFKKFARTRKEIFVKLRMNQAPELSVKESTVRIKEEQDSTIVVYALDVEGDLFDDLKFELDSFAYADSIYGVMPEVELKKGEMLGDTACFNFTVKSGYESEGVYYYRFATKDASGNENDLELKLEITNKNRAPEVIGANVTEVTKEQIKKLNLNKVFTDPDRQKLTYTAMSKNPDMLEATVADSTLAIIGWYEGETMLDIIAIDEDGASKSLAYTVEVTDRDPSLSSTELSIYPNPVVDILNCEITLNKRSEVEFRIYDSLGRLLYQSAKLNYMQGKHKYQIPVSNLPGGVYVVQYMIDGAKSDNRRFVK